MSRYKKGKSEIANQVVVSSNKMSLLTLVKTHFVSFLIIFIVVIGGISAFLYHRYHKTAPISLAPFNSCSGVVANEAYTAFRNNDTTSLKSVVDTEVKRVPNYQSDANCMYIITMYNLNTSNGPQAEISLAQFNKIYNGKNLSSLLQSYASAKLLRVYVANLTNNTAQIQNNVRAISPKAVSPKSR